MAYVKRISGSSLFLVVILLAATLTYAFWAITEPYLAALGTFKYVLLPIFFALSLFSVLPIAASLLVFAALLLTQTVALKHVFARKAELAPKKRLVEYYEYDDDSRDFVKKTGYF